MTQDRAMVTMKHQ